jgi:hypothetical protein
MYMFVALQQAVERICEINITALMAWMDANAKTRTCMVGRIYIHDQGQGMAYAQVLPLIQVGLRTTILCASSTCMQ